jgi:hypothetical protein
MLTGRGYHNLQFKEEAERLKRTEWPACDRLAEELAKRGPQAADAFIFASKSRKHHVRSASLAALYKVDTVKGAELAKKMMADRALEVREVAARILGVPIPDAPVFDELFHTTSRND